MKKLVLLFSVLIVLVVLPLNVNAKENEHYVVASNYLTAMQEIREEWQGGVIKETIKLYGNYDKEKAYLYRVYKQDNQQGYMVVMNLKNKIQVVEATFNGVDPVKSNDKNNYYVAPFGFYTKEEYKTLTNNKKVTNEELDSSINLLSSSINPDFLIPVPAEYIYKYYGSYVSIQQVQETPEYFNYSYGPVTNGCGPTSAAMLTSFFDRVTLPNLVSGTLPLQHSDNKSLVDNHIILMADYLNTCSDIDGDLTDPGNCTGTNYLKARDGLTQYFVDRNYWQYNAVYSTNIADYSVAINNGNPVYLRLYDDMGTSNTSDDLYHAVLGIGQVTQYGGSPQFIVRYNHLDKSGDYQVSKDLFNGLIYMYHS